MSEILSVLLPVFAVIAMGRAATAAGLLDGPAAKSLSDFALWTALPALLFRSIAEAAGLSILGIAGVYLGGCLLVYGAAVVLARFVLRHRLAEAAAFALNATYGNVIFLGTPIVAAAFGPPGVALILAIIALHSGVLLPLTSLLVELGSHGSGGLAAAGRNAATSLLRNPIIVSIGAGMIWHFGALPVPSPLDTLLNLLGAAATPLALFCVGASLPPFARDGVGREAALATVLKLLVLPPVIGGLAFAAGISGLPLTVAVLTAAMPTGANAFLLSRRAPGFVHSSATTVVVTTAASVATLSLLLVTLH